ncbi:MAG TPA: hypothetical protein VH186_30340 [Chloroflexia bacterium]|nr:hypothetical protein [Chloroflexia bacterium]
MLVVKQVDAANQNELAYECYEGAQMVGRLTAWIRPDRTLEARLSNISIREAGRTLMHKLERDASAYDLPGLYLQSADEKERDQFLSNGYEPVTPDTLLLYKPLKNS